MAQYADLTSADKAQLDNFLAVLRPLAGQLAQIGHTLDLLKADYLDGVNTIVASLDAGALVPNQTDLADATDVTKEDITAEVADMNTILADFYQDADKTRYIRMAGVNAILE